MFVYKSVPAVIQLGARLLGPIRRSCPILQCLRKTPKQICRMFVAHGSTLFVGYGDLNVIWLLINPPSYPKSCWWHLESSQKSPPNHPTTPELSEVSWCGIWQAEEAGKSLGVSDRLGAFLRAFADVKPGFNQVVTGVAVGTKWTKWTVITDE